MAITGVSSAAQQPLIVFDGRVSDAARQPIQGARVEVATLPQAAAPRVVVDADGRFRFTVPRTTSAIKLSALAPGFVPIFIDRTLRGQDTVLHLGDIVLRPRAQMLQAVHAEAARPRPERRQGSSAAEPGEVIAAVDIESLLPSSDGTTDDAMLAVTGAAFGIDPATGRPIASVGGLSATQNAVTVNGAATGSPIPRDGGLLQLYASTYDPTKPVSGLTANWLFLAANYMSQRQLRYSLATGPTVLTSTVAQRAGRTGGESVLSGHFARAFPRFVRFVNSVFQLETRRTSIASLATADATTLNAFGLPADSVQKVRSNLAALGLGSALSHRGGESSRDRIMGYTRLDFTGAEPGLIGRNSDGSLWATSDAGERSVFYVIAGGSYTRSAGIGLSPASLGSVANTVTDWAGSASAVYSSYLHRVILNESRLTIAASGRTNSPTSALPSASVLVSGGLVDGSPTSSLFRVGGSGMAPRSALEHSIKVSNLARWRSRSGMHEWRLGTEVAVARGAGNTQSGAGGFAFNSIADLLAGQPSSFQRLLASGDAEVTRISTALGLGDTYRPTRSLAFQYGIRLEQEDNRASHEIGSALVPLTSASLRAAPKSIAIAPMAGFTWTYARDTAGLPDLRNQLIGGVRDYRGVLSLQSLVASMLEDDLTHPATIVRCVGSAVPAPNWAGFEQGSVPLPSGCTDGTAGVLSEVSRPVNVYLNRYAPSHSIRAELTWMFPLRDHVRVEASGSWADNSSLTGAFDLNFDGTPRFNLPAEAGRPVFVSSASVVPVTGAMGKTQSRRDARWSEVVEQSSTFRSRASTVSVGLRYQPEFKLIGSQMAFPVALSYRTSAVRSQTNGFMATTAGDPREREWSIIPVSKHMLVLSGGMFLPRIGFLRMQTQLRSGIPYTPMVNADINGDGLANDRAMIFADSDTSTTARAMRAVINSAPSAARRCLTAQSGRIAAPSSCMGPWSARVDLSFTFDSYQFGLQNRGSVRLLLSNVLSGLDVALHGPGRERGWGQPAMADPVLLRVRSFAPATGRFTYNVNPLFGTSRTTTAPISTPFRLTIDVMLDIGRNREASAIDRVMRPPDGEPQMTREYLAKRLTGIRRPPFERVVAAREALVLSDVQVRQLDSLSDRLLQFRDSAYFDLAGRLINDAPQNDAGARIRAWHAVIETVIWFDWHICQQARGVLTAEQNDRVFAKSGPLVPAMCLYSQYEARRYLSRWFGSAY